VVASLAIYYFQQIKERLKNMLSAENVSMDEIKQVQQAIEQSFPDAELAEQEIEQQYKSELQSLNID
jgi:capsule polysaccharide export protein KpsC/LpsZ